MSITAVNELGKMDFLKLLSTQLSHQDPSNPVDNGEFIAQLAQFSALEAAENTNANIEQMSQRETQVYATALLGHKVSGIDATTQELFNGVVTAVSVTGDKPLVYINGRAVSISDIQTIQ